MKQCAWECSWNCTTRF